MAYCRRVRFSLIKDVLPLVFFGEAIKRDVNFLSQGHERVPIFFRSNSEFSGVFVFATSVVRFLFVVNLLSVCFQELFVFFSHFGLR